MTRERTGTGPIRSPKANAMAERESSPKPSGALASLLDLEEDVARRIAEAHESSERALLAAKESVERERANRERETEEALQELRAHLLAEHQAALEAIALRARAEAERYDGIDEASLSSLADAMVDDLLTWTTPRGRT